MKTGETVREKGIETVNAWRIDWNRFVNEAFGVSLDREQQEILSAVQTHQLVSVASGTARGKDFVAACSALCFLYLTPRWNRVKELIENTKVALTAPTDRQVKNIMMPEISRLYHRAYMRGLGLPGKLNAYDIRTGSEEWFLTGFKADEHHQEAWSGFHAVHTMFVVTEASGIPDAIFDAIEGNLQGDSRLLIVFNPNTSVGYAAKSQKSERWKRFRLSSLTAPNVIERKTSIPGQVDYEWVKDKVKEWCTPVSEVEVSGETDDFLFEGRWYRPEDLFRVKVLGKFPKVDEDVLVPEQWIESARERWRKFSGASSGIRRLGVDVAGMGRDSSVYCDRHGNRVLSFRKRNSGGVADHMRVAGEVTDFLRTNKEAVAMIDTIGEGAGVFSRLVELGYANNENKILFTGKGVALSCKYSEAAKDVKGNELKDITGQYSFVNMRAYLYWCVRDWLNPKNNTGAMLPPGGTLGHEAGEIKWNFRSDGKIAIEPKEDTKKRLGFSPDEFDALANTFYPVYMRKPVDISRLAKYAY
ncbi:MAG: hypothetical protein LBB90_05295 [Tannerella sp.]|jgi:hypothetical protein|nr:hypothetical protein [Tannerella sp.]